MNKNILFGFAFGFLFVFPIYGFVASTQANEAMERYELVTIADARKHPAKYVDVVAKGRSVGDMFVFDQPLLDENKVKIGNNSGFCIRVC